MTGVWFPVPTHLALGGHERVMISGRAGFSHFEVLARDVRSSDPTVLDAQAAEDGAIDLIGLSAGTSLLRVIDSDSRLLDRTSIEVAEIAQVEAVSSTYSVANHFRQKRFAFAPGEHEIGIALFNAQGERLIDEQMEIEFSVPTVRTSWDSVIITIGTEDIPFAVIVGDTRVEGSVQAAGLIDDFDLLEDDLVLFDPNLQDAHEQERTVQPGQGVCFAPLFEGARVVGAPYPSFHLDGQPWEADRSASNPCIRLPSTLGPTATITVARDRGVRTFVLRVGAPETPAPLLGIEDLPSRGSWPGDRSRVEQ